MDADSHHLDPARQRISPVIATSSGWYDAHIEGYYYKPRIDGATWPGTVRAWSACRRASGEVSRALEEEDWELRPQLIGEYGDIFGLDGLYVELKDHGLAEQRRSTSRWFASAQVWLPLVATNDLHYVRSDRPRRTTSCCASGTRDNDTPNGMRFEAGEFYFKSAARWPRSSPTIPKPSPIRVELPR